jgi:hypothetical protein
MNFDLEALKNLDEIAIQEKRKFESNGIDSDLFKSVYSELTEYQIDWANFKGVSGVKLEFSRKGAELFLTAFNVRGSLEIAGRKYRNRFNFPWMLYVIASTELMNHSTAQRILDEADDSRFWRNINHGFHMENFRSVWKERLIKIMLMNKSVTSKEFELWLRLQ